MKKFVKVLSLVLALCLLLASCGTGGEKEGKTTELTMYTLGDKPADYDKVLVKINEFNGEKLEVGYLEMPKDADYIRIAISNFAGFSAWDRFRFWLWDLGLEVSTTEQFFLITWFEDVFGSNESEVDPTAPTDSFPDMIYPGGAMVM